MRENITDDVRKAGELTAKGIGRAARTAKVMSAKLMALLAGIIIFCCLISGGLPETSFNSFSHHNPDQDPVTQEDKDSEDLSDAKKAEAEGADILADALSQEKVKVYDELERLCDEKGVSFEASLQFLDSNFAQIGSESFSSHADGTYTEEEYEACVFLSAYSVSVDNLWGESEGNGYGGAIGAVQWAIKIAGDNSFTYGKSPAANHSGCYFCGNQGTKQRHAKRLGINRSYEKTYCCNPFVTAAFVHGAGDPYIKCKGAIIGLKQSAKKNCGKRQYRNFEWLGHIPKSQLQTGDVLLTNKHAKLYAGGGKQVEATGGKTSYCWSAKSIRLTRLTYPADCEVMRYKDAGGLTGKTYNSYKTIKTIGKSDVIVAARITGKGSSTVPQSMAYMGENTYAVAYSNTNQGDTVQYIRKYKGGRCTGTARHSLGHANGLCYNPKEDMLYSVRGNGNRKAVKIKGKNLKAAGSRSLPTGTSGIAYDRKKNRYYLSSGNTICTAGADFSLKKRFKKVGAWRYAQDCGGYSGIVFSSVSVNKSSDNRIGLYDAKTGNYYGSFKLGWSGIEIEDCEVDDSGHLLILVNRRGSNTDYIYKSREALAGGISGGYMQDPESLKTERDISESIEPAKTGAVSMHDNWRVDMYAKLTEYLGKNDYYGLKFDEDEKGKPIVYEGVIDVDEKREDAVEDYKEDHEDNLIEDIIDEDRLADEYDRFRDSNSQADAKKEAKYKKPSLTKAEYIKAKLHKKDVFAFASGAFGVTKEDAEDLYGKGIGRDEALSDMAMGSLALLHDIDDFEAQKVSEEQDTSYEISDKAAGNFKVSTYCLCGDDSCRENLKKLFGKTKLPSANRKAGVSCAADPKIFPVGTVIHSKKLGILVVEDSLKRGSGEVIAVYTGKSNKESSLAKKQIEKTKSTDIYLVSGITPADAKALGGGDGIATGRWIWPVKCSNISSPYGNRICPFHGREFHAAYDIAASYGSSVYAADGGTVIKAGYNGGFGNSITISHGRGLSTMYNHLSKIQVKQGQKVSKGQVIGKVGSTGSSTGAHLDFRVYVNGNVTDPFKYYPGVNMGNASSALKKYYRN